MDTAGCYSWLIVNPQERLLRSMFDFFTHRQSPSKPAIFFVPQPDPFENPLVETNPNPLRQWATTLPFANPDQLSEAVLTSLARLNRFPGVVRKRDELMEIYHTPALRLLHGSASRRGSAAPQTLRRVMLEMAYGYSHLANECLCNKANRKNLERLKHAIYHAIRFYLQEYLSACEEFDCRTSHTYREISRLRTYAEEQRINFDPVGEADAPDAGDNIEQQYNRFLLFLLLDPCHLQEGEPRVCFEYLDTIAGSARCIPPDRELDRSGHYVVDRLGEVPPGLFEPAGLDTLAQPRFAVFDLNPVSQQIHQQLRGLERSEELKPPAMGRLTAQESTNLLARMLKSWHIRPQRDSERHATSGQVSVWKGLQNIHSYLTRDEHPATYGHADDEGEITLTHGQALHSVSLDPAKPQLTARRFNQSRSGVALHLSLNPNNTGLVGELVLISLQTGLETNEWKIGIIKRALNRQGGTLEVGIQFVQGRIVPVTLQSTHQQPNAEAEETGHRPVHPGLYIDQGHTHRSSLIVPKRFFAMGQEYRVEEMIPTPSITPLQMLESTSHFERYRIKPA